MKQTAKKTLSWLLSMALVLGMLPALVQDAKADGEVAQVGDTGYATFAEALTAWTNGTTRKLLADVTIDNAIEIGDSVTKTLDLNGYGVTRNHPGEDYEVKGSVIIVSGGSLTLTDSRPDATHYYTVNEYGQTTVAAGETENTFTGGYITGGTGTSRYSNSNGGGIMVWDGGSLTMQGGTIIGNSAYGGGGVCVWPYSDGEKAGGSFTMEGGAIIGNLAYEDGGGGVNVGGYEDVESTFTMSGGTISGNAALAFNYSTNTMESGFGGVSVYGGVFNLTGGSITDNTTKYGNVFFTQNGNDSSAFLLSGSPTVSDICVVEPITVAENLTVGNPITVSVLSDPWSGVISEGPFAVGDNARALTESDLAKFSADDATLAIVDNKAVLRFVRTVSVADGITGGSVSVVSPQSGPVYAGDTVAVSVTPNEGYQLKEGSLKAVWDVKPASDNGGSQSFKAYQTYTIEQIKVLVASLVEVSDDGISSSGNTYLYDADGNELGMMLPPSGGRDTWNFRRYDNDAGGYVYTNLDTLSNIDRWWCLPPSMYRSDYHFVQYEEGLFSVGDIVRFGDVLEKVGKIGVPVYLMDNVDYMQATNATSCDYYNGEWEYSVEAGDGYDETAIWDMECVVLDSCGYFAELSAVTVQPQQQNDGSYTFTMPPSNVTVYAAFEVPPLSVTIPVTNNGENALVLTDSGVTVTVDNRSGSAMRTILDEAAAAGHTVSLVVKDAADDVSSADYAAEKVEAVYDIHFENEAGTEIPYSGGDLMMTIPYSSYDPNKVYSVIYKDGDDYTDMHATYDESLGAFVFYTAHTSTYFIYAESFGESDVSTDFDVVLRPSGTDGKSYDVILNAKDGKVINRFVSADLTFSLTGTDGNIVYRDGVTANGSAYIKLNDALRSANRFEFYVNGSDGTNDISDVTGKSITLGTVHFGGDGNNWVFRIENAVINTTKFNDNVVLTTTLDDTALNYTATTAADAPTAKIDPLTLTPDRRNLTVNVTFPNTVKDNGSAYQDMTLTVSGGDLAADIVTSLGGANYTAAASYPYFTTAENPLTADKYTVEITNQLTENVMYAVTLSGAGYRTVRYNVLMTADKTLTFWNNAMDADTVVEAGKADSAVKVTYLAGDIVQDAQINIYDLSAVVSYFGTVNATDAASDYAKYDLNRDGKIDSIDVAYVLVSWGK